MQNAIFDYINFPNKCVTIAQSEMWKTKTEGGIKLVNMQIKSETSKAKWLTDIVENENLKTNMNIFTELMGTQNGEISGKDLIFLEKSYIKRQLKTNNIFYKEALLSLVKFEKRKRIQNLDDWDNEHIFYNPLFLTKNGKTLTPTKFCEKNRIYQYSQLIEEKRKEMAKLPFNKPLIQILDKIRVNTVVRKEDIIVTHNGQEIKLAQITQKILYEETLLSIARDHHSQAKWVQKLDASNIHITWKDVWNTVHNVLSSNETKTIIWQQIHLNFYTQYSYNKWYKKQEVCPLCKQLPDNIYHVILDCQITKTLWQEMKPILSQLHASPVTEEEKAFGVVTRRPTTGILLRNWLTYIMRTCVSQVERLAHHAPNAAHLKIIKGKIHHILGRDIHIKSIQYTHNNNLQFFDKVITHGEILCKKKQGQYEIQNIFA